MRSLLFTCCALFILSPWLNLSTVFAKKANSGPYKTTVVRVAKCEKTSFPLDNNPPLLLLVEAYNISSKNLLRGNLTVVRENKQVKLKLKSFLWQNDKWKLTYLMNNIGCHGVLLHMMNVAMGLKYDRETCGFLKGQYYFNDIDPNAMQHIWASTMEYGRILWTSETTTGSTTYSCWEFETWVEPI